MLVAVHSVMLLNPETEKETSKRIISEVKTGTVTLNDVRAFYHTMNEENAIAGIFITLNSPTKDMLQTASNMGDFQLEDNRRYPRLQFWQVT